MNRNSEIIWKNYPEQKPEKECDCVIKLKFEKRSCFIIVHWDGDKFSRFIGPFQFLELE